VSSSTYLYLQANILFLNSRKTSLFHVNRWTSAPATKGYHSKLKAKKSH
jgi:hypothetical protein